VIGEGTVFPRCPQHQVEVLVGAVVNGPNGAENFEGIGIPDGAIDFTSTGMLAFALAAAG